MNIEELRKICHSLKHTTEDIKWGHDLVFSIGGKMYCVTSVDESPTSVSFKVTPEEFDELSVKDGFKPAPYVAKHKWVLIDDVSRMNKGDWEKYLRQSYQLVKDKLPVKIRKQLD